MRVGVAITGPDADAASDLLRADGHEVAHGSEIADCDLIVVDEWTPETSSIVVDARRRGTPVTVLAELILDRARGPVVGITGTAGKTSTARALENLLAGAGVPHAISRTARSSNAWPDHSLVGATADGAVLIAELTSTHLCHMQRVHPDIAVVTLIRPDHAELHGGIDAYHAAKRRLVAEQGPSDSVVLPADDPDTLACLGPVAAATWWFGEADPGRRGAFAVDGELVLRDDRGEVRVRAALPRGPARRAGLAAAAAALALGVDPGLIARGIPAIPPVPHRMASHVSAGGVTVIDDSMAATPLKAMEGMGALAHLDAHAPVIIVGGDDALGGAAVHRAPEEETILEAAVRKARSAAEVLVAFGPATDRIRPHAAPDVECEDIHAALAAALASAGPGGVVLVSPMFPMRPDERMAVAGAGA
jgi:UDP-N-acetylmuramoylalanine--D-glutamate ligase